MNTKKLLDMDDWIDAIQELLETLDELNEKD